MLHITLASHNNIIGWSLAAVNQEHWSFMDDLLIIQPIDATTKDDVAICHIHKHTNVLFRCLLRLTVKPTNEEIEENPCKYELRNTYIVDNGYPCWIYLIYQVIREFDYSTPEEAMNAAIQELEWTEFQIIPGIPSDYYSPYKS